jgi:hypothetical protein
MPHEVVTIGGARLIRGDAREIVPSLDKAFAVMRCPAERTPE